MQLNCFIVNLLIAEKKSYIEENADIITVANKIKKFNCHSFDGRQQHVLKRSLQVSNNLEIGVISLNNFLMHHCISAVMHSSNAIKLCSAVMQCSDAVQ